MKNNIDPGNRRRNQESSTDVTDPQIVENLLSDAARGGRRAQDELIRCYWPVIESGVGLRLSRKGSALRHR